MADYFTSLGDDMAAAYKDRTSTIATIARETDHLLKKFDNEHKEMAAQLKAKLSKDESERVQQTQAEISKRETEVAALLKQFDEEHAKMSKALLSMLAKEEKERGETSQAENRERASQWQAAVRKMAGVRGTKAAPKEVSAEKRMNYQEFAAKFLSTLTGSSQDRMRNLSKMWKEYKEGR